MQTTFVIGPEEWTEKFWRKIMPPFNKKKIRITVEEVEPDTAISQYDSYLKIKKLQEQFPTVKIDESIDLSRLADESNAIMTN